MGRVKPDSETSMDCEPWSVLGEELVDKILARLPLTKLYQAVSASKTWSRKLGDKSFRAELMTVSHKWPVYCPLLLSGTGLIGFDSGSQNWQKLFSLDYVPHYAHCTETSVIDLCSSAGSLLCFAFRNNTRRKSQVRDYVDYGGPQVAGEMPQTKRKMYWSRFNVRYLQLSGLEFDVTVTNVVTKQWKLLPRRPHMQRPYIVQLLQGSDWNNSSGYRVVLFTPLEHYGDPHRTSACLQIYNSITESWSVELTITSQLHCHRSQIVYFNKKLYMMSVQKLRTYDIENATWSHISFPPELEARVCAAGFRCYTKIVTLESGVMLIAWDDLFIPTTEFRDAKRNIVFVIYKLDCELQQFVEVSRGPPELTYEGFIDIIVGRGDVIYFGSKYFPSTRMFVYNLRAKVWGDIPPPLFVHSLRESLQNVHWTSLAFQPGLNSFIEV